MPQWGLDVRQTTDNNAPQFGSYTGSCLLVIWSLNSAEFPVFFSGEHDQVKPSKKPSGCVEEPCYLPSPVTQGAPGRMPALELLVVSIKGMLSVFRRFPHPGGHQKIRWLGIKQFPGSKVRKCPESWSWTPEESFPWCWLEAWDRELSAGPTRILRVAQNSLLLGRMAHKHRLKCTYSLISQTLTLEFWFGESV